MAQQTINNGETGLVVRTKLNSMFGDLYTAGAANAAYIHTQGSASATWTVAHNLHHTPHVSVTTTGGEQVWADVNHTSADVTVITFAAPLAGYARFS
jgi:hypothetical protein